MKAVIGIALFLASTAHAQAPGGAPVKITIELADPARPIPPRGLIPGPELDADLVLSIALPGSVRPEQEQILADLIAKTPDREVQEKANHYFLLGELQARQHRHWRATSAELARKADQAKTAKARAEAAAAAEQAKQYLAKAVKTYQAFTGNAAFRDHPKMDTALFYYGYTLQSGGQMSEARKIFYKLIKDHPASKHAPEAHLAFADHFFTAADLASAETYYKAVLKFPRSPAYWYATYRLGWIHLGQQRFQDALETFFQAGQATRNDPQLERLSRASSNGFVVAYAEIGKPDKARPAFLRVDGRRALDMLQLLGEAYLERGKPDRAIVVYQELRAAEPSHPNACQWLSGIARATAYNATTPRDLELCPGDLESFRAWARASGVTVTCASCPPGKRP